MKFHEIKIGQTSEQKCMITQAHVTDYIHLTGDDNSVHQGEMAIVHGMLLCAFISTFIGKLLPGDGAVWISQHVNFIRPVHVGDEITITGRVATKIDTVKHIKLFIDIYCKGDICTSNLCWVKVPE